MAETIAHSLMENLEELMSFKKDLIGEEKDQIAWLYKDLQLLIAFLKDLQIKFKDHEGAKNLEARIRDVVYEAETAVDLFIVNTVLKEEKAKELMNKITMLMKKIGIGRSLDLGHVNKEIKAIKTKVYEMCDKRTYSAQTVNNVGKFSRSTNSNGWEGEEGTMMGFEQETMFLKEQLRDPKQLKIISIVGMAGQGKTTLATGVYNDDWVTYHFDRRAWISVSQEYQKRDLLLGLLTSVLQCTSGVDQISNNTDDELALKLQKSLKRRRYFIVMDDIWDDHRAWFDLKNCFPDDNNGSRILFTSRHEHVALLSKPMCFPHLSLRSLTPDESWNLLQQKIFQRETCPSELMEIGKQIAQKCRGLPLAIVVVAGILRNEERSQERWKQVGETLNSQMAMEELWTKTIAMSYNHLPPHLKPCFLYFAIFPEDFQIPVWKLIWLWVAEGFIRKTGEERLEDVAEKYLMELIGRSLVLVSSRGYDGRIKACGIHDLLREFCLRKAEEEYFLQRIMGNILVSSSSSSSSSSSKPDTPSQKYTRTYFRFHIRRENYRDRKVFFFEEIGGYTQFGEIGGKWVLKTNFKLLRVLHSRSSSLSYGQIDQLVLLKYLDLGGVEYSLPASISNLWNLETIIVSTIGVSCFYLPHSIRKMEKLRHLRITGPRGDIDIESPDYLVDYPLCMYNLQTLSWINPWSRTNVIARSPNLRKLGLQVSQCGYNTDGRLSLLPDLDFLNHLQELKVCTNLKRIHNLGTTKFPSNLTKLALKRTRLTSGDMSTLAKLLPNLEALKLYRDFRVRLCWETSEVFPKLKFLKFASYGILQWVASSDHFPSLERLVLKQCSLLEKIPSEIGDILTLKAIELHQCKPSLASSAKQIKEGQESLGNNGLQVKIFN